MIDIQNGSYEIRCVLINSATVLNNDGVRQLEIEADAWTIQPAEQRFEIIQTQRKGAILNSNGQRYFAEVKQVAEKTICIELKRANVSETISIEAEWVNTISPADQNHLQPQMNAQKS